jgi:hypothetical protein
VGRLPIPSGFEETAVRLARGEAGGEEVAAQVVPVVGDVVKRQVEIGLDCIGDGEYWSALDIRWLDQQMTGLSTRSLKPGEAGSMRESTRERDIFRTLYADMDRVGTIAYVPGERPAPADARAHHRQRAHQDQRYRHDAAPARLLQGGDRALRRRPGRGFCPRTRAWVARPFHL